MNYPKWSYSDAREFRRDRRKAMRAALKAVRLARFASAYLPSPAYEDLQRAHKLLNRVTAQLSPKEWGR